MDNVKFKHGDGSRGVNLNLVTWWEVSPPEGSALLHFMGGSMLPLSPDQWGVVAPVLQPADEPQPVAQSNVAGSPASPAPAAQS